MLLGLSPKQFVSILIERYLTKADGTNLRRKWSNVGKWDSFRKPKFWRTLNSAALKAILLTLKPVSRLQSLRRMKQGTYFHVENEDVF